MRLYGGIDALAIGGGSIRGLPVLLPRGPGAAGAKARGRIVRGNSAESFNTRGREDKENEGGGGLGLQAPVAKRFPSTKYGKMLRLGVREGSDRGIGRRSVGVR